MRIDSITGGGMALMMTGILMLLMMILGVPVRVGIDRRELIQCCSVLALSGAIVMSGRKNQ